MNRHFYSLSVRSKLIVIMVAVSMIVGIIFSALVLYKEEIRLNETTRNEVVTLSKVIASNVVAPLLFGDQEAAKETLQTLSVKPDIALTVLLDTDGRKFSEYKNETSDHFAIETTLENVEATSSAFYQSDRYLVGTRQVIFNEEPVGTVIMAFDLSSQKRARQEHVFLITMILIGVSALAFFLSTQFQKAISLPIDRLNSVMREVSQFHDFSLRVDQNRSDEIGELYQGFNDMLRKLEVRDNELTMHQKMLENDIRNRTRQLDDIVKQRIDWLESMANFLRHELKNNIAAFSSCLQLIERKLGQKPMENEFERAWRSLRYMNQLLDSVGGATSLQASLYGDSFGQINLTTLIANRIDDLTNIYGNRFHCDLNENIFIQGNEERMSQLLDKLISNAVDHSSQRKPIDIGLQKVGRSARLSVSNFGPNITKDGEDIFDAFVSIRDTNRDEHMGIGLFVVKLIAESHGGRVHAKNKPTGDGVIFEVILPIPQR